MNPLVILITVLLAVLLNAIIGAAVWSFLDRDGRLLDWIRECPSEVVKQLAIQAWPVVLWFAWKQRERAH